MDKLLREFLPLNALGHKPFTTPVVYLLIDCGVVCYVGHSTKIADRVLAHQRDKQFDTLVKLVPLISDDWWENAAPRDRD
jgi:hypothetical protein